MGEMAGLGKAERANLAQVVRGTKGTIGVAEAAGILAVSRSAAAKMLSRWASKGWVSRVRRGLYIAVPLESRTADVPVEDPWVLAERLFSPCYCGGWTAAEHWGLTEQIFSTIVVMTTRRPRDRSPEIKGTRFSVHTIPETAIFGVKPVWRGALKVLVSDPSRTLADMLSNPSLGGGARPMVDVLKTYLGSEHRSLELLVEYGRRLGNGAVFKRLGFLLERLAPEETAAIESCRDSLSQGTASLDPTLSDDRLITRWKLWVPDAWAEEAGQ